ncbi:MAG: hypothetical protein L6309_01165 [Candidatus Omnitrophica bacterium]|nr:hypothetical protein [Candidatus Omnitrophota bacterium]
MNNNTEKNKATGIKSWPEDDRPREKLLKKGAGALSNSELLAILLRIKEFYVKRGKVKPEFVTYINRAKQLEQKYSESLDKAQENRVVEQYGVEIITNDDAEWIIEDAKDFVLKIEEVLAS